MAEEQPFDVLLDHLKRNRGFDFRGYKRASLERRVERRMGTVGIDDYLDYVDYLEVHPEEFALLFNAILINVTGFMRDRPAWDYLRAEILPRVVEGKGSDGQVRVWCAGCASGEEAYSAAIALAELMGHDAYLKRVKIYATDVDEEALDYARLGAYLPRQVEAVPRAVEALHAERILARRYFWPGCHNMQPYRSCYPHAGLVLPVTNAISERVLVLPTGTSKIGGLATVLAPDLRRNPTQKMRYVGGDHRAPTDRAVGLRDFLDRAKYRQLPRYCAHILGSASRECANQA